MPNMACQARETAVLTKAPMVKTYLPLVLQDGLLKDNRRMLAGFMAGVTEALVIVTPFEVVKIRLQQQRGLSKELLKYRVRSCSCTTGVQSGGARALPAVV